MTDEVGRRPAPPAEPFRLLKGRGPSFVEIAAQLSGIQQQLSGMAATQTKVLETQRKLALQTDGLQATFNQRMDVFHEELALLRALVTGDHAPRITAMEKLTAKKAARIGGQYTGIALLGGLALRILGRIYPDLADVIETVLSAVGL